MILNYYNESKLTEAFGIDLSSVDGLGVNAAWGRVAPGVSSKTDRHDETEFFVIVAGEGKLIVDGHTHHARPGTIALFEPFESHTITNTGHEDLVFLTQYWRDAARAQFSARSRIRPNATSRHQFIFSAPPTPNGDLHLGHLSGPYLGADVYVRYQRLIGNRAWHLTGSDDFQSYVEALANREKTSPTNIAHLYSTEIAATLKAMDIVVDQYNVTSVDEGYIGGLQRYFTRLTNSSWVKPKTTSGLIDGETGQYLYEANVSGTCPTCSKASNGNMCEECGEPNVVTDLGEPRSHLSQGVPQRVDIERYTLPLHEFANMVADHHRLGRVPAQLRVLAHRVFTRNTIDLPVSHPSRWGVRPAEATLPGQVIWVWPEMSYGFLHGIERLGAKIGERWSREAPEADWKIIHFFGSDNSFYYAILYPILYRIAFPEWKPEIDYHVNEFYLLEGEKFSSSRRHAIWGKEILSPETVDAVRYYLCSTRPENQRTNFIRSEFNCVVSDILVGQWEMWLTSLGKRVSSDYGGIVPDAGTWTSEDTAFLSLLSLRLEEITAALNPEGFSPRRAVVVLNLIVVNVREFSRQQFRLAGLDQWSSEARTAIALELAAAQLLAYVSAPLMPRFSARLAVAIGIPKINSWPEAVELVRPGTQCTLAETRYFVVRPQPEAAVSNNS